jgi:hypothetical protein
MKDFLTYLKQKSTWVLAMVFSPLYFLLAQAYVYPTLSFDFSVIYNFSTWAQLIFMQSWMTVIFYFALWRPNRKALLKEKTQDSEAS